MTGIELIVAERQRQIEKEGFGSTHDDRLGNELSLAASCYLDHVVGRAWVVSDPALGIETYQSETLPDKWPVGWDEKWWKPTTPVRDLVKAGALIAAEIDRRLRAGGGGSTESAATTVPDVVHLVLAQWEHEGNSDLAAFRDKAAAEAFVALCEAHQKQEPDDDEDATEWEDSHPGKPYLQTGDTLHGVESFVIVEIMVL